MNTQQQPHYTNLLKNLLVDVNYTVCTIIANPYNQRELHDLLDSYFNHLDNRLEHESNFYQYEYESMEKIYDSLESESREVKEKYRDFYNNKIITVYYLRDIGFDAPIITAHLCESYDEAILRMACANIIFKTTNQITHTEKTKFLLN